MTRMSVQQAFLDDRVVLGAPGDWIIKPPYRLMWDGVEVLKITGTNIINAGQLIFHMRHSTTTVAMDLISDFEFVTDVASDPNALYDSVMKSLGLK